VSLEFRNKTILNFTKFILRIDKISLNFVGSVSLVSSVIKVTSEIVSSDYVYVGMSLSVSCIVRLIL